MASQDKTVHYELNRWRGTDKPTRSDFVRDNEILDTVIWDHANSSSKHLTSAEKARVSQPYYVQVLQGNGEAQRSIDFDFEPKLVIYFSANQPPVSTSNDTVEINFCIAAAMYGGTAQCSLGTTRFTVNDTTVGDIRYALNSSGRQYVLIAFK